MSKFKTCERSGFQMTFENGWTISVQWHSGAYCERRSLGYTEDSKPDSVDAEVAAWDKDGNWYTFPENGEETLGWQTTDDVANWMNVIKSL